MVGDHALIFPFSSHLQQISPSSKLFPSSHTLLPPLPPLLLSIMPSMTNFAVASVALATMVQFCPAPFLAGIGAAVAANIGTISGVVGAASGVAGTVIGGVNGKRDIPPGLFRRQEEYGTGTAWQDCHDQLTGATVTFSSPSAGCTYHLCAS